MNIRPGLMVVFLMLVQSLFPLAHADTVSDLLADYTTQGAGPFSSEAGQSLLHSKGMTKNGSVRRCTSCHGEQLNNKGKHLVTGKVIQPLAPSSNSERLTERKKIEKWFRRNCKWTFGRECTAQEKGDFLTFLKTQ